MCARASAWPSSTSTFRHTSFSVSCARWSSSLPAADLCWPVVAADGPGDRKESKRSSGGAAAAPSTGSGSGSGAGSSGSGSAAGSGAASESKQASASGGGCRRHRCGHHGCPCHDRSLLRTGLLAIGATVAVCKILKWTGIIPSRCHKGAAGGTCPVPHGKPAS
jgi:hypothetical protein